MGYRVLGKECGWDDDGEGNFRCGRTGALFELSVIGADPADDVHFCPMCGRTPKHLQHNKEAKPDA